MPKRPNTLARILVPLGLFILGLGVVIAIAANTGGGRTSPQTTPPPQAQGATPEGAAGQPEQPAGADQGESEQAPAPQAAAEPGAEPTAEGAGQPDEPAGALSGLRPESFAGDPLASGFAPLGGLEFAGPYTMRVEFSHVGAGVSSIRLARRLDSVPADRAAKEGVIEPERHVEVQQQQATTDSIIVPLAAIGVEVEGTLVPLTAAGGEPAWRQVSRDRPGVFEAFVVDGEGERVLRLERAYSLAPESHDLVLRQSIENLTDAALDVRWRQFGPVELFADAGYGGEKRRVRFGYLAGPESDPTRQWVGSTDFLWPRSKFIDGQGDPVGEREFPGGQIWPNKRSRERGYELVWVGMTNRYFAAVAHPLIDPSLPNPDKVFHEVERIDRVTLPGGNAMVLSFSGPVERLPARGSGASEMGLYAGPLSKEIVGGDPMLSALGVEGIVVYNFGGMCAFCTFEWLTTPLLGLLRFLHSLTSDWALAIILLVVCVRTLLHPVTRWSQIRMQVFGKQMQGMAPKQKAIQEKYKDDRQRLQQEMAKLWREEGVSPAGFLGCLPMFLQSPVWIALYATLYFAVELRHEPAFFGVFQALTNNAWPFLADLAEPDRAIYFGGRGFDLPFGLGRVESVNLLPLLLGVVFYIQQKYLTPPTSGTLTPEQESQQRMMKIMMVVMFPLIMYPAPSGLALYFITNSTLGILESRWIRKHVEKSGLLEPDRLKKKPREGGFMARLKQMAEEQQKLQGRGMSAKRAPRMPGRDQGSGQRRYKKR